MGEKLKSVDELGGYTSLGLDYDANPSLRLGLDTSYHFLVLDQEYGSNFGAFEVGTHVLFGRP
jgi:outer membrane protein W